MALYLAVTSLYVPKDVLLNRSLVALGATALLLPLFLSYKSFGEDSGHVVLNRNEDSNSNADSYKKLASTGRNYTMGGNDTQFASLVANNIDGGEDKKATVTSEEYTLVEAAKSIEFYMILFSQLPAQVLA